MKADIRACWERLSAFSSEVIVRVGLTPEDAALQAAVLVWADLRGVDSHRVLRIPWYLELLDSGRMNARPRIEVIRETAATALIEGDRSPGPVVTTRAIDIVKRKAHQA